MSEWVLNRKCVFCDCAIGIETETHKKNVLIAEMYIRMHSNQTDQRSTNAFNACVRCYFHETITGWLTGKTKQPISVFPNWKSAKKLTENKPTSSNDGCGFVLVLCALFYSAYGWWWLWYSKFYHELTQTHTSFGFTTLITIQKVISLLNLVEKFLLFSSFSPKKRSEANAIPMLNTEYFNGINSVYSKGNVILTIVIRILLYRCGKMCNLSRIQLRLYLPFEAPHSRSGWKIILHPFESA